MRQSSIKHNVRHLVNPSKVVDWDVSALRVVVNNFIDLKEKSEISLATEIYRFDNLSFLWCSQPVWIRID